MPLLVGLDGVKKMSKSLGNYVGIAESADVMYGKLMSLSDDMMRTYFTLCTDVALPEIDELLAASESGAANPKDVKRRLAREIITLYHDADAANAADAEWNRIHSAGQLPTDIPEVALTPDLVQDGGVWICKILTATGMAKGTGEARRLIEQGGVSLNGEKVTNTAAQLQWDALNGAILRVGARRYARLKT